MKISKKQWEIVWQTYVDTLGIVGRNFMFDNGLRTKIYNEILNQQSDELVEIGDE